MTLTATRIAAVVAVWALLMACIPAVPGQAAAGQAAGGDGTAVEELGATVVGATTVAVLIAYTADSALLGLAIRRGSGPRAYVPLFASTYRGVPSVTIEIVVSADQNAIWVRSSWPDDPVLAHYRLGAATAITPFGVTGLMATPFPETLGGGPAAFPNFDPGTASIRARFNHRGPE